MQEIIKKAIEGGYKPHDVQPWLNQETVLDLSFWQSLGKACGWHFCRFHSFMGKDSEAETCHDCTHDEWFKRALQFHEINLTEGWDKAVQWLNDLINNKA